MSGVVGPQCDLPDLVTYKGGFLLSEPLVEKFGVLRAPCVFPQVLALCHIAVGQQMNLHWLHKVRAGVWLGVGKWMWVGRGGRARTPHFPGSCSPTSLLSDPDLLASHSPYASGTATTSLSSLENQGVKR